MHDKALLLEVLEGTLKLGILVTQELLLSKGYLNTLIEDSEGTTGADVVAIEVAYTYAEEERNDINEYLHNRRD